MSTQSYRAAKTRSGRPGWSVAFRHPLKTDGKGRPGKKVRKGLGTSDEAEADRLVAQMNELLSDQSWWSTTKKAKAERTFDGVVVDAFFEGIQAGWPDPEQLREEQIRLPDAERDGYSRVLFVGTTGAGKTSLLRQLIGSDPNEDRFPSTAPAKTTIADIEVVQTAGEFDAAVTFFTEFQIRTYIEECVTDACWAAYQQQPRTKIAERLLNHRDQKFRLSYVLGAWRESASDGKEDFSFDDESDGLEHSSETLDHSDRESLQAALEEYVERITGLSEAVFNDVAADIELDAESVREGDKEAADDLIEESFSQYVPRQEEFEDLVNDILDAIRNRFDALAQGELVYRSSDWPSLWTFHTKDRDEFIKQIRWFSSNHWNEFGRLLTPIVQGLRVKGPLFPGFLEREPNLVLIDGQGLGHTPDSSSSVTTNITDKFPSVDLILLVDNAQQPMQAAPLSVLRAVAARGYHEKLAVAFTHFDQIKGPSLKTPEDRRQHVLASVHGALNGLRDSLGEEVVRAIEAHIDDRAFMLGGVDRRLRELPHAAGRYMVDELTHLVDLCEKARAPARELEAAPVYDPTGIVLAVQEGADAFQEVWKRRLEGGKREHWTRIKALNRRFAEETAIEYDSLKPIADLSQYLSESISRFLAEPSGWVPHEPSSLDERETAIARVRQRVSQSLSEITIRRLRDDELPNWRAAYQLHGLGSTFQRARTIRNIYQEAAPVPDVVMQAPSKQFLSEIQKAVRSAIEEADGQVRLAESA